VPDALGGGRLRWGDVIDVQRIGTGSLEAKHCAGYLAKYATKATEQAGGVLHPVTEHEVDALPVREHVLAYLRRAFALDTELAGRRLGKTAHAFGYRGHCLTKSRRYSTTFKELRAARGAFVHEQLLARSRDTAQLAIAAGGTRSVSMRYTGQGHITAGERYLAQKGHDAERERRRVAREELSSGDWGRRRRRARGPR
jgi:hypothetical protein